jgi:hypothetical protein
MAQREFEVWKVTEKMVKDPDDRLRIEELITENYGLLKQIFTNVASRSSYPYITTLDISHFCNKCGIVDKVCNMSSVDRVFIAT